MCCKIPKRKANNVLASVNIQMSRFAPFYHKLFFDSVCALIQVQIYSRLNFRNHVLYLPCLLNSLGRLYSSLCDFSILCAILFIVYKRLVQYREGTGSWYLYSMVTQNMLRTLELESRSREKKNRFADSLDFITCLN